MQIKKEVFVFGSNEAGRHGAGSALKAYREYGAIYGQGNGIQGSSYGIPTKDATLNALPIAKIEKYVKQFIRYAELNPDVNFRVVRIGCGLAGFTDEQIAPLFAGAPAHCILPAGWRQIITEHTNG
jgi:hypothetical protein